MNKRITVTLTEDQTRKLLDITSEHLWYKDALEKTITKSEIAFVKRLGNVLARSLAEHHGIDYELIRRAVKS